jgi:hypothetical protein
MSLRAGPSLLRTAASCAVPVAATGREPWTGCAVTENEDVMEFLVEFEFEVPKGTPETEVEQRTRAEVSAAARLVDEGHLLRLWKRSAVAGDTRVIGRYDAEPTPSSTVSWAPCLWPIGCMSW